MNENPVTTCPGMGRRTGRGHECSERADRVGRDALSSTTPSSPRSAERISVTVSIVL